MRKSLSLTLLFLLGLASASCGSNGTAPPSSPKPEAQRESVEVIGEDFAYVPEKIDVPAGGELTLVNRGYAFHDLKVEGEDGVLISEVESGGRATSMVDLAPGRYVIYCTIAKHRPQGMEGILVVR